MSDNIKDLFKDITSSKGWQGKVHLGNEVAPYDAFSSGCLSLDYATGVGGLTKGIQVELYGPPGVGKTSLMFYAMAEVQKAGRWVAYIGMEGPFAKDWAHEIAGVDSKKVISVEPVAGEDASMAAYKLATDGRVGLVVFDSVGSILDTRSQESGTARVGGSSSTVTTMINRCLRPCWQNQCTIVYINQLRSAMSATAPMATKTPGGYALEYGVSLRIELRSAWGKLTSQERAYYMGEIDGEDAKVGDRIAVRITKNKANSAAGRTAQYDFWFRPKDEVVGIDRNLEAMDLGSRLGVIDVAGSYYSHPGLGEKRIHGRAALAKALKQNPEILEQIRTEVIEKSKIRSEISSNGSEPHEEEVSG